MCNDDWRVCTCVRNAALSGPHQHSTVTSASFPHVSYQCQSILFSSFSSFFFFYRCQIPTVSRMHSGEQNVSCRVYSNLLYSKTLALIYPTPQASVVIHVIVWEEQRITTSFKLVHADHRSHDYYSTWSLTDWAVIGFATDAHRYPFIRFLQHAGKSIGPCFPMDRSPGFGNLTGYPVSDMLLVPGHTQPGRL